MGELAAGQRHPPRGNPRLVTAGACALLAIACFLAGFLLIPVPEVEGTRAVVLDRVELPEPQPIGEFTLREVGPQGPVGDYDRSRLLGQWTPVYFGNSHCPDV